MRRHFRPWLWPAYRQLLLRSKLPIIVGPFRGEFGFETLYWLPFLAKLRADGLDPARLFPIARAGTGSLYEVPQGLELYAMRSVADLRIHNREQQARWGQFKQTHVTQWDREVIRDAAQTLGLKRYLTLHPAWLYQLLTPFWQSHTGLAPLNQLLRFTALPVPSLPDGLHLPENFIAVKFYHRYTFPRGRQVEQFVAESVKTIAKHHPVVYLDWDGNPDDHSDVRIPDLPNVTKLSALYPSLLPETSLSVQSAIVGRAMGFVGTYGGFAHLALMLQRPTISYYWQWGAVVFAHRVLSEQLALATNVPFHCLRVTDLLMLQEVMPRIAIQTQSHEPSQLQTV